ncbi:pentatricopeptide repeat-containing protein At2g21090 isoform X2 [Hevea brasiliensis]|uniref:pentatricopeptide repeat-containing protein At2g21090 isoform X2 n=1 Tax=Hevea brasiliensis TaxID=3981 RepID=UPI0025FD1605|nr:pentatricopeptide repeat-containing protein At2g21090 isoform X2 [Hevea brasiliensis]
MEKYQAFNAAVLKTVKPQNSNMRMLGKALPLKFSRHICTLSTANLTDRHLPHNNNLACASKPSDQNPTFQNVMSLNKILSTCVQSYRIQHTEELFDKMPLKDVVSWNIMLSAFNKTRNPARVCKYFKEMQRVGIIPNEYTFSIVLSAVLDKIFNITVPQIHARVISLGLNLSLFVGSALIRAYAAVGDQMALSRVFDEMSAKNITSWNALVSGYMELGCISEAQRVFDVMPEKNTVSWTILVNGYIANRRINEARSLFNKMSNRNVVSWTVMISGVLDACAGCSSLLMGQQVHSVILKAGVPHDVVLLTSLVDMYGKCGDIVAAFCIFESMKNKNLMSWNSIIGGYARHGLATRALEEFERMIKSGVRPDQVTFLNILSACGHGGLVEEGEKHFGSMGAKYGIKAGLEHYTCMVDLYGRAGQLDKAEELIKGMPYEPDVVVWGALLGACGIHSSLELGAFAARGINKLKEDHPVAYSMLSKIHGERGEWNGIVGLRKMMKQRHVKNQKAGSWIESPLSVR